MCFYFLDMPDFYRIESTYISHLMIRIKYFYAHLHSSQTHLITLIFNLNKELQPKPLKLGYTTKLVYCFSAVYERRFVYIFSRIMSCTQQQSITVFIHNAPCSFYFFPPNRHPHPAASQQWSSKLLIYPSAQKSNTCGPAHVCPIAIGTARRVRRNPHMHF